MKPVIGILIIVAATSGQTVLPEGTKVRVRIQQSFSSAHAQVGQDVELSVTEDVVAGGRIVIARGARVAGRVLEAQKMISFGGPDRLDFSADQVQTAEGEYVALRAYKNRNGQHRPAGVLANRGSLFVRGSDSMWDMTFARSRDIVVRRGQVFSVYTNAPYTPMAAVAAVEVSFAVEPRRDSRP